MPSSRTGLRCGRSIRRVRSAAVIKADGYGLGARKVAAALHAAGCRHFFVAYLDEALAMRDVVPGAMLAVLGGLDPGTEDEYVANDYAGAGVVGRDRALGGGAVRGRDGDPAGRYRDVPAWPVADEVAVLAEDHSRLDGLTIRYVMSHLVVVGIAGRPDQCSFSGSASAARGRCCRQLPTQPGEFLRHLPWGRTFGSDLARPGAALYGINPTPSLPNPMRRGAVVGAGAGGAGGAGRGRRSATTRPGPPHGRAESRRRRWGMRMVFTAACQVADRPALTAAPFRW